MNQNQPTNKPALPHEAGAGFWDLPCGFTDSRKPAPTAIISILDDIKSPISTIL